jgi:hypothetical protein
VPHYNAATWSVEKEYFETLGHEPAYNVLAIAYVVLNDSIQNTVETEYPHLEAKPGPYSRKAQCAVRGNHLVLFAASSQAEMS